MLIGSLIQKQIIMLLYVGYVWKEFEKSLKLPLIPVVVE